MSYPINLLASSARLLFTSFKNNKEINKSIRRVAVVAMDSPKFRTEKECMENESYKWFTDFQAALAWLKFFNNGDTEVLTSVVPCAST